MATPGHRQLTPDEAELVTAVKEQGKHALDAMDALASQLGRGGREFALAKTKFEEAVMWAVKGITS